MLSTGEKVIVENAPGDYYWGCGKDGSGLNRLGQILEQVRKELRQEAEQPCNLTMRCTRRHPPGFPVLCGMLCKRVAQVSFGVKPQMLAFASTFEKFCRH